MGEGEPPKESGQNVESILTQEFVKPILAVTKEFLKSNDHLGPALFLRLEGDERSFVPLSQLDELKTTEEKQSYFSSLGLLLRQAGEEIREAILVSEVWYVEPEEKPLDLAPSKHPKRKQAIAIVGRDSPWTRYTHVLQPFVRDSKNMPVFEPLVESNYNVPVAGGQESMGLIDDLFD